MVSSPVAGCTMEVPMISDTSRKLKKKKRRLDARTYRAFLGSRKTNFNDDEQSIKEDGEQSIPSTKLKNKVDNGRMDMDNEGNQLYSPAAVTECNLSASCDKFLQPASFLKQNADHKEKLSHGAHMLKSDIRPSILNESLGMTSGRVVDCVNGTTSNSPASHCSKLEESEPNNTLEMHSFSIELGSEQPEHVPDNHLKLHEISPVTGMDLKSQTDVINKLFQARTNMLIEKGKLEVLEFNGKIEGEKEEVMKSYTEEMSHIKSLDLDPTVFSDRIKQLDHEFSKTLERFEDHMKVQRRRLRVMQIDARNKEREIKNQWIVEAEAGKLTDSFHKLPLSDSGFRFLEYQNNVKAVNLDCSNEALPLSYASSQQKIDSATRGPFSAASHKQSFEMPTVLLNGEEDVTMDPNYLGSELDSVDVRNLVNTRNLEMSISEVGAFNTAVETVEMSSQILDKECKFESYNTNRTVPPSEVVSLIISMETESQASQLQADILQNVELSNAPISFGISDTVGEMPDVIGNLRTLDATGSDYLAVPSNSDDSGFRLEEYQNNVKAEDLDCSKEALLPSNVPDQQNIDLASTVPFSDASREQSFEMPTFVQNGDEDRTRDANYFGSELVNVDVHCVNTRNANLEMDISEVEAAVTSVGTAEMPAQVVDKAWSIESNNTNRAITSSEVARHSISMETEVQASQLHVDMLHNVEPSNAHISLGISEVCLYEGNEIENAIQTSQLHATTAIGETFDAIANPRTLNATDHNYLALGSNPDNAACMSSPLQNPLEFPSSSHDPVRLVENSSLHTEVFPTSDQTSISLQPSLVPEVSLSDLPSECDVPSIPFSAPAADSVLINDRLMSVTAESEWQQHTQRLGPILQSGLSGQPRLSFLGDIIGVETSQSRSFLPQILSMIARMPPQGYSPDPFENELIKLGKEVENYIKFYEDKKQQLRFQLEQEVAKVKLAFDAQFQVVETEFVQGRQEIGIIYDKLMMNRKLAEEFSKRFIKTKSGPVTSQGPSPLQQSFQSSKPRPSPGPAECTPLPTVPNSLVSPSVMPNIPIIPSGRLNSAPSALPSSHIDALVPHHGRIQNGSEPRLSIQNGSIQNVSIQNGSIQNVSIQNGSIQNVSIQNVRFQNGSELRAPAPHLQRFRPHVSLVVPNLPLQPGPVVQPLSHFSSSSAQASATFASHASCMSGT